MRRQITAGSFISVEKETFRNYLLDAGGRGGICAVGEERVVNDVGARRSAAGAGGAGVTSGDGECIVPACFRMMGMAALGGRGSIVLALPACLWNGGCAWVGDDYRR
ncbi:predicted protein [Histoplasma capsulatum G186AR]|uniref:Uncharacterized protein n=1 Tax=Ajellomyces capsulatus (strain G186AR / H82 / ATCC MYA-2454 / RMSCC 2432) TaxID=447093 RepID=C0NC01_AJECG|nr:uncharacterized protein HCBG_00647 [Histoplasma capsulatum G186AR]EEH11192.1 predicted protein [Histoplasma capsulatum G186AR]